jgi:hypothetical protein
MAAFVSFEELEIGDQFLTEWIDGTPIKLTVKEKTEDGEVLVEETDLDISLDHFYVVDNVKTKRL